METNVPASGLVNGSFPAVCHSGECFVKPAPEPLQHNMSIDILTCAPRFVTGIDAARDECCFCMVSPTPDTRRFYMHGDLFSAVVA